MERGRLGESWRGLDYNNDGVDGENWVELGYDLEIINRFFYGLCIGFIKEGY